MKYFIIACAALLVGCSTTVKHKLPEPPKVLTESCLNLNRIADDETKLSEFAKVVVKNYSLYHECASKHELLLKWYNEQKVLHDEIFNR